MSTPGADPRHPLWTRESQGASQAMIERIELGTKIILLAYTCMAAWQMAKMLNPPLKVKQDMLMASIKQRVREPAGELPELTNADRAALYDDLRG